ncbi:MAG: hypothetical protein SAMD01599839_02100 [Rectinema sp.]
MRDPLLPPEFYRALKIYNQTHPDAPLFLLQEIWPEENPPGGDYLRPAYQEEYLKEINYVIDAVYGRANVPQRKGRAWGVYSVDVSKWLIGWLVGRELESVEVMQTDADHKGATYTGEYVSAGKGASPTEVWLAESLDAAAMAEAERYGALHPVGIVSWPTLDPIEHDTEWDPKTGKSNRWNDRASVAIEHLDVTEKMTAGLFGAYHIYPNYPDFIVNEPSYGNYRDVVGILRYGGLPGRVHKDAQPVPRDCRGVWYGKWGVGRRSSFRPRSVPRCLVSLSHAAIDRAKNTSGVRNPPGHRHL